MLRKWTSGKRNKYRELSVSPVEAADDGYKRHLGGGERTWEARGAFQLALMRHLGLEPKHRLVDFGCGPLRGGQHFIRYLEPRGYRGFDFNADFIAIARDIVARDPELRDKSPELAHTTHFLHLDTAADFILLFSVLNHCGTRERLRTLRVAREAGSRTRICISHASWYFALARRHTADFSVHRIDVDNLPATLDPVLWGWKELDKATLFPMVVLSGSVP